MQHLQNLRLHRGIQSGGRFVGDDQPWAQCQCTGDQRTLAQATGQLIGSLAGTQFGLGHADFVQQLDNPLSAAAPVAPLVGREYFQNLFAHRAQRVERDQRILQHKANAFAAQTAPATLRQPEQILPAITQSARRHPRPGTGQTNQAARRHAFTRAGLTHQRQGLARRQGKRHIAHHGLAAKLNGQALNDQVFIAHDRRPSRRCCR